MASQKYYNNINLWVGSAHHLHVTPTRHSHIQKLDRHRTIVSTTDQIFIFTLSFCHDIKQGNVVSTTTSEPSNIYEFCGKLHFQNHRRVRHSEKHLFHSKKKQMFVIKMSLVRTGEIQTQFQNIKHGEDLIWNDLQKSWSWFIKVTLYESLSAVATRGQHTLKYQ